jgi:REP element-mobilizing transposase RayT
MRTFASHPNQGPVFYITTVLQDRLRLFTRPTYIVPIFDSLIYYRSSYHFKLLGYVCMPDHLHLLLWPQQPSDIDGILRDLKGFTSRRLIRQAQAEQDQTLLSHFCAAGAHAGRSEHQVWQASFWEQDVYSAKYMREKLVYLHRNPVRAGLVPKPEDYPYSSYRAYLTGEQWLIEVDRQW